MGKAILYREPRVVFCAYTAAEAARDHLQPRSLL